MYIPPFVCGILATLIAEFVASIIFVIVVSKNNERK